MHPSTPSPTQVPQTEEHRRRGLWLYRWAQENGIPVSHDEVLEALTTNSLHPSLQAVMAAKDATQAVVAKLCDAARENDTDTIKVCVCGGGQFVGCENASICGGLSCCGTYTTFCHTVLYNSTA